MLMLEDYEGASKCGACFVSRCLMQRDPSLEEQNGRPDLPQYKLTLLPGRLELGFLSPILPDL